MSDQKILYTPKQNKTPAINIGLWSFLTGALRRQYLKVDVDGDLMAMEPGSTGQWQGQHDMDSDEAGGDPGRMVRLSRKKEGVVGTEAAQHRGRCEGGGDGDACISEGVFKVGRWETSMLMTM